MPNQVQRLEYSRLLWLYFPLLVFIVTVVAERIYGWTCFSACEDGPLENLQVVVVLVGAVYGLRLVALPKTTYPMWARGLFVFGAVACIYIALEEVSYGQRIFGWGTPENWGQLNDQNETNLHNTSSWLDQKPKLILEIGVYVGGILLPLLQRFKPSLLSQKLAAIYPDSRVFVVALMALATRVLRKFWEGDVINRTSELQEVYLYAFVMLYFIYMYQRYANKNAV